jgi:hypothetical protein
MALHLGFAQAVDPFQQLEQRMRDQGAAAFYRLQETVWQKLAPISELLVQIPDWAVSGLAALLVLLVIVSWRLTRLLKPDAPYKTPFVKLIGYVTFYSSVATISAALVLALVFVGAHYFTQTEALLALRFATHGWMAGYGVCLGLAAGFVMAFRTIPQWERGLGLPDVQELVRTIPRYETFNPGGYFKRRKGCFVGKDARGTPIYVPWAKLRETHIQIFGTTGSGKGKLMAAIAYQCGLSDEAVWWFDPKDDRYSSRLMRQAAEACGKPFIYLNLNADQPPQFKLLAGASAHDISDLFVAGFDLRGKGTDGDFHRGRDEDAAMQAAELAVRADERSLHGVMAVCVEVESIVGQEHFWRCLRKVARLPACQTDDGVDLSNALEAGAVVYVVGSADSEVVKMLQKMVLVRLVQLIKARDRSETLRPVCVFLDEFKHLLSPVSLTALGTVRDFGAHFMLAHQSLGDLESCPGISPADAYGAVVDNTAIKFVYRINDGEHAERLARTAGMRRTYSEISAKATSESSGGGGWREMQTHHLNPDLLTHLPMPSDRPGQASVGVLLGYGMARLFTLGSLPISGALPQPVAAPRAPLTSASSASGAELI